MGTLTRLLPVFRVCHVSSTLLSNRPRASYTSRQKRPLTVLFEREEGTYQRLLREERSPKRRSLLGR